MFASPGSTATLQTTSYRVVIPFYLYAIGSLLLATVLLYTSAAAFTTHYFQQHILAITHIIALGWGTMMILGASHQLVPVLIEGKLYSSRLALLSFYLAATGISLLVYGFYRFDFGWLAQSGGSLVTLAIIAYLINIAKSISEGKRDNIHAVYIFTATGWLFLTAAFGLLLVFNFAFPFLPGNALYYLPLHAHAGIIGWFVLLVIGVGSRLIPMFLISKYTNTNLLRVIFYLVNGSLISFILLHIFVPAWIVQLIPVLLILAAIVLFIYFCFASYKERIRKRTDEQLKLSLLSVVMMLLPVLLLAGIIAFTAISKSTHFRLTLTYGFLIFFGWLTAIVLGMTFKTLPFIVWNKVYHKRSGKEKTPNPKDLYNDTIFKTMAIAYIAGLVVFVAGILSGTVFILKSGALFLFIAAFLYNWNVILIIRHKPRKA